MDIPATTGPRPDPADPGFTEEFAYQVALGYLPLKNICASHGVSKEKIKSLMENPVFRKRVAEYRDHFSKTGVTTELKAAVAVDALIPDMYRIASNEDEASINRIGAFDRLFKVSGKEKQQQTGPSTPQFMVQVVLPDGATPKEINAVSNVPVVEGLTLPQ